VRYQYYTVLDIGGDEDEDFLECQAHVLIELLSQHLYKTQIFLPVHKEAWLDSFFS
jgi:hypothetical protein